MRTIDLGQGAYLELWEHWLDDATAHATFLMLHAELAWQARAIRLFGREIMQPRLVAYYGDPEAVYTYSGVANEPLPWTDVLARLRTRLVRELALSYNAVLCNLYRDGRDAMGMHSDDEPELGRDPVVASLSLGAVRTFSLRSKQKSRARKLDLPLASGSLLVMRGATQRLYRHGVPKARGLSGPRINLTFRHVWPRR